MKKITFILSFLLIIFSSCGRKYATTSEISNSSGKVIAIIDGDTYDILAVDNKKIRVRMEGIDAPEKGMPFFNVSKKHLSELCFSKTVTIFVTGVDNYSRVLAYSYLNDGTELSHEMVRSGLAWHYKKYNSDIELSELELSARVAKKGLWINDNPMAPWTNRSLHKQGISTKDSFIISAEQK